MSENKAEVTVESLEAKVKIVEEKEDGVVVDRHLVTEVKLQYEGTPALLEEILYTLKAGHTVKARFSAAQLPLATVKEPAEVAAS